MDVRCLLTLEFVSVITHKWKGGVKRPWRISHAGACEMLQIAKFLSTGQEKSGLFSLVSPCGKFCSREPHRDAWKSPLY